MRNLAVIGYQCSKFLSKPDFFAQRGIFDAGCRKTAVIAGVGLHSPDGWVTADIVVSSAKFCQIRQLIVDA